MLQHAVLRIGTPARCGGQGHARHRRALRLQRFGSQPVLSRGPRGELLRRLQLHRHKRRARLAGVCRASLGLWRPLHGRQQGTADGHGDRATGRIRRGRIRLYGLLLRRPRTHRPDPIDQRPGRNGH